MAVRSESISINHLSTNLNYEPQRTNNFQVEIYGLPGAGTETVMLTLQEFSLPNIKNNPIEIKHGNTHVKFAGVAEWTGSDRLTVLDWITTDVEKVIVAWRKLVYDEETDKIGWAANYKKQGLVTEFGPDGTFERNWKFIGLWPSGVNYGATLSHDTNDVKKIELDITYDKAFRV